MQDVVISDIQQAYILCNAYFQKNGAIYQVMNQRKKFLDREYNKHTNQVARQQAEINFNKGTLKQKEILKAFGSMVVKKRFQRMQQDNLILVNPNSHHSQELNVFLNNNASLTKNLNRNKRTDLLNAYNRQDWTHPIFTDPLFIQTALGLFDLGRIDFYQFETLLEIYYATHPLRDLYEDINYKYTLRTHAILDKNNQFTQEAQDFLIQHLPGFMKKTFTETTINNFKLLIVAFREIYPAENCFFMVCLHQLELTKDLLAKQIKKLNSTLYYNEDEKKTWKIYFPYIIRDALRLACFPFDDVVYVHSMAGEISIKDVDNAVTLDFRPKATVFPNVASNKDLHNITYYAYATAGDHDNYHADTLARQGKAIRNVSQRIKLVLRRDLLSKIPNFIGKEQHELFSKAVWWLVDGEFSYFNLGVEIPDKINKISIFYCVALLYSSHKNNLFFKIEASNSKRRDSNFLYSKSKEKIIDTGKQITDTGIICFIDMARHTAAWHSIGFAPNQMPDNYRLHYEVAQKLKGLFIDDSIYNILIYRVFILFGEKLFPLWKTIIDSHYADLNQKYVIKRNNLVKKGFLGVVNTAINAESWQENLIFTLLQYTNSQINFPKCINCKALLDTPFVVAYLTIFIYGMNFKNPSYREFINKEFMRPIEGALMISFKNNTPLSGQAIQFANENLQRLLNDPQSKHVLSSEMHIIFENQLEILKRYQGDRRLKQGFFFGRHKNQSEIGRKKISIGSPII